MSVIAVPRRALDARVMLWTLRAMHALGSASDPYSIRVGFEVRLLRSTGLFDAEHYLSQLDAASLGDMSAARHYVLKGDAQGLSPNPLFHVAHYDSQGSRGVGISRLLHYMLHGRFQGWSPSPWLSPSFYLNTYPDVASAGLDPLEHFYKWGWREERSPSDDLDLKQVLRLKPELRVVRGGVLRLFATGGIESFRRSPGAVQTDPSATLSARPVTASFDPQSWKDLARGFSAEQVGVEVLIPVYRGLPETLACLWSVLIAPVRTPHHVRVIDDASPDAALSAALRELASLGLIELERNPRNLGFVKTVNKGLRLAGRRDVVILNADTEVYGDWLDRMLSHAAAHPRAATITPLSNNATICSYPEFLADNRDTLELEPRELDALAARVNAGAQVAAPTGVGFCMYLRRAALQDVGSLDERHFGRGYGEENDLCQRMALAGWRNVIACDVYVRHLGSVSFGAQAQQHIQRALRVLSRLHPGYHTQVAEYIGADPAWIHRARLDLERLKVQVRGTRNVLLVCHSRGGGTERHLNEQTLRWQAEGIGVFELRQSSRPGCVAISSGAFPGLPNLATIQFGEIGFLDEVLETLAISDIHVHHLIDFPAGMATWLKRVSQRKQLALRISIHDYHLVCPRVNMVNLEGRYCDTPSTEDCNRCLSQDGMITRTGTIQAWRQASMELLRTARELVVPSADTAQRFTRIMPGLNPVVEAHEESLAGTAAGPDSRRSLRSRARAQGGPPRILVIGAINRIKGYDCLLAVAKAIYPAQPQARLSLLGYSSDDLPLSNHGVALLGRYFDAELPELIEKADPDLIWIPSIWPETYCYALSGALKSGRRVAVFDLGAQAERLRQHAAGHSVLSLSLINKPQELLNSLLKAAAAESPAGTI